MFELNPRTFCAPSPRGDLFDTMFRDLFPPTLKTTRRGWKPALDLAEDAEGYLIRVELPGIDPANVSVTLTGDRLEISGHKEQVQLAEGHKLHATERSFGSFQRTIAFPTPISGEVTADFTHGVLEVRVPKPARIKPRVVQIKTRAAAPISDQAPETQPDT
jgi:HSP20 family protein